MGPLEIAIVACIGLYLWALVVAGMKHRWMLFAIGLIVAPAAFVGALLPAKPGSRWSAEHDLEMKRCPRCAEDVKAAAQVCRFCGHTFPAQDGSGGQQEFPRVGGAMTDPRRR